MDSYKILTIWILLGIPASGKSTWALEQLTKYPGKYKRTNRDSLRAMLDGDSHDWDNEKFVVALRNTIIERALRKQFDVIVDDTNLKSTNWTEITDIAKKIGNVRVVEKYFDIDLKEALERNSKRDRKVPENVIENFYKKYIKGKQIQPRDEFFPRVLQEFPESDPKKSDAIIVDVDGTVALHWDRSPYDMSRVINDKPNIPICDMVKLLSKTYTVLIASGREDCAKGDTELWLLAHDIPYSKIFMRKTGDNRKDVIIKEEIYKKEIEPYYNVKYVLDDRLQVVNGWRKLGLCCMQVADGDF